MNRIIGWRVAPEGRSIIFWSIVGAALVYFASRLLKSKLSGWIGGILTVIILLIVQFFRDPDRFTPSAENVILAAADGRVMSVGPVPADSPIDLDYRISIFMSPLNVHVNRSPVHGIIRSVEHHKGRFFTANKPRASLENEHTFVVVDTAYGKVAFSQIAGFLVRRIVFHAQPGWKLCAGQRVGIIKFGSRVDVYLPRNASIYVQPGDKVRAGETILGEFRDERSHART